jgi:ABC-type multidrug transport system fused ATPase/permease subunit
MLELGSPRPSLEVDAAGHSLQVGRRAWRLAFYTLGTTLLLAIQSAWPPLLTRWIINDSYTLGTSRTLRVGILALGLVAAHLAVLHYIRARVASDLRVLLDYAACRYAFERMAFASYADLVRRSAGEGLRLLGVVREACGLFADQAASVATALALVCGTTCSAALIEPVVALAMLGLTVVLWTAALILGISSARVQAREAESLAVLHGRSLEALEIFPILRAGDAMEYGIGRWMQALVERIRRRVPRQRLDRRGQSFAELLTDLLYLVVLLWISVRSKDGLAGDIVFAVQCAVIGGGAVVEIGNAITRGVALYPQVRSAVEDLGRHPARSPSALSQVGSPSVEVDRVWFRHAPDAEWVLRDVSLPVRTGRVHVLRGPSGIGKSTLLRLIAGLQEPERGAIRVTHINASLVSDSVMYVPQDARLISGTILENLRVLSGYAPMHRIEAAVAFTRLGERAQRWPLGLQTTVSPGLSTLSGGERQLVILTAALATERRVVLLDEPLSHLDSRMYPRLDRCDLLRGRTVIVASHVGFEEGDYDHLLLHRHGSV